LITFPHELLGFPFNSNQEVMQLLPWNVRVADLGAQLNIPT